MQNTVHGIIVNLAPDVIDKFLRNTGELTDKMIQNDQSPIVMTSSSIRLAVRTLTEINFPKLSVVSYNEIAPEVEIFSVGILKI
jgi:flagellar biosynthesis protein FlhA